MRNSPAHQAELAARDAELAARDARIAQLEQAVTELRELLGRNSQNSNKPPSSDPPGSSAKRRTLKPKGERKRGGQKGHRGSRRELAPACEVDRFVELFPSECGSCWKALPETPDAFAKRYQQVELEPLAPQLTEYRRHAVLCACGYKTRAAYDAIGDSAAGVRAEIDGGRRAPHRRLSFESPAVRATTGASCLAFACRLEA